MPSDALLPPGLALDELVAERVMNWRPYFQYAGYPMVHMWVNSQGDVMAKSATSEPPPFSTDPAAAWLVVERMRALGWIGGINWMIQPRYGQYMYLAEFSRDVVGSEVHYEASATPAHAICLAALAALGGPHA